MKFRNSMRDCLAKWEIYALMRLTAKAAGRKASPLRGLTRRDSLRRYMDFTAGTIAEMDETGRETLRRNMYDRAFVVGRFLGRLPGRKSDAAKTRMIRWLYRNIDISIVGDMPGEISVPRCAFSDRYTPETCYVMSGMDAGIICGIFGGGEFGFRHRLTEGCPACKAAYRR